MPDEREPFQWLTVAPSPPLSRHVESVWFARGRIPYRRERIAPTGSTVAVFVLGDPILETPDNGRGPTLHADKGFLIGPHTGPVINEPTGETHAVGIVTTPIGCPTVFGIGPSTIKGRVVDLVEAWRPTAAIREAIMAVDDPVEILAVLQDRLRANLRPDPPGIERVERAVELLQDDPARPVADVADGLGVSHGHLDREFTRIVGLSPAALSKLLRIRRLLEEIDVSGEIPWSGLAVELGWFDQAHLIRDFKRHTGVSPSQYVAAQRSTLPIVEPGGAAGFVPEM
jgi:AraC-like DNA-binding protein